MGQIIRLDHRHHQRPPDPEKNEEPRRGALRKVLSLAKLERSDFKRPPRSPQLRIRHRFHDGRVGWAVEVSDDVVGDIVLAHHRHRATADAVAAERAFALGLQVRP